MNSNPPKSRLGRTHIKGFAGGIAHKFSCSFVHYAWLAYQHKKPVVTIDLFSLLISPPEFDIERNLILAKMCRDNLLYNIQALKPPGTVTAAVLIATFDIDDFQENHLGDTIGAPVVTVMLTDDRGKEWHGEVKWNRTLMCH